MSKSNKEAFEVEETVANQSHLEFEGIVTFDTKGCFKVKLDSGQTINAKPNGKMRKNKIQIITGDRVIVACSPYDPLNGLITRRISSGKKQRFDSSASEEDSKKERKVREWK